MSAKDKLETWLTETPKHLVTALFSLAATGIILVVVILFIVAPRIAALPNVPETNTETDPKTTAGSSQLLVEVSGKTFRTNSTLNMGILQSAALGSENKSPVPADSPAGALTQETSPSKPEEIDPFAKLNLEGVSNLTYPSSLTSVDTQIDRDSTASSNSRDSKWSKKTPAKTASLKANRVEAGDPVNFAGLKAFFADLKTGNFAAMQRGCWTITPEVFTDRFTTKPAQFALVEAFGTAPKATDTGLKWSGKYVDVTVTWRELSTRYSCPSVAYGGKTDAVSVPDVLYLMERLMARTTYPLSPGDSEANYPLLCPEWNPPTELTEFSPKAADKLSFNADGLIDEATFSTLQKIMGKTVRLYAVSNDYPMYLRASESQLKGPSAYFFRDKDGSLCIGSVVEKR